MTTTQQGLRQESARQTGGTETTYEGDLRALFEASTTIPAGRTYNEAFILWLQSIVGSTSDNVNDLAQAFAETTGAYNWSSVGQLLQASGPFADTTAITADDTTNTADSF